MSCLGLEYFCFEGDGLWNAPDDELIALAKQEIAKIGLIARATSSTPAWCASRRPIRSTTTTIASNVAMIRRDLEAHLSDAALVGRNGMHKYNNQDHAMMTAMLTARNILAGERVYDVWNVNEDAEYHEAGDLGRAGSARERARWCRAR